MNGDEQPIHDHVRKRMSRTRGRDTKPEVELRRQLHALGLRYRVNVRPEKALRYSADLLFVRARVAVFVDGCFWHRCPEHFVMPKSRTDFWRAKIEGNVARDNLATTSLQQKGWTVLRIWEHTPVDEAVEMVLDALHTAVPQSPTNEEVET